MIAGTLEIQLLANMARLREDMQNAQRAVGDAMRSIESVVNVAKAAFVAFTGVASINAFKGMIQGSIEATASLYDMSLQTGASVASLTAFRSIAVTTDTTIQGVAGAMNKLAKGMAVANEDSKGIGQAVQALGLDFNKLKNMKPEDQMMAVAKAMDGFQDGAGKSAAAMTLFGKEGAKMLPFFKDLADASDDFKKSMTEQEIAAKKAQAAMADDYADNIAKIKESSEILKREIAHAMLPALHQASQALLDVNKEAGGLKQGIKDLSDDGSINNWTRSAIFGVTYVMDAFEGLKAVITSVGKMAAANVALMVENASMAWNVFTGLLGKEPVINIITASMARQKVIAQELALDLDKTWGNETFGKRLRDRMTELQAVGATAKAIKPDINFKTPDAKAKIAAAKEFADLNEHVLEAAKANLKTIEEEEKARQKYIDVLAKSSEAVAANVQNLQDENAALILSENQHISLAQAIEQVEIARLQEALAVQMSYGDDAAANAIQREIDNRKKLIGLIAGKEAREATAKSAKEAFEEWKKTAEKINDSITDALMRGFESGKSFFDNFWDTIKNKIKTDVLRVMVQPVAHGITGMLGLSGAANAAGTAGAASGIGTLGSVAAGVSAFGGTLATGFMNTLVGSGMSGGLTAAGAMIANGAWASGLGMAAGALGPIGLGIAALSMIGNKDKSTANTGNASARYDSAGNRTDYQTYYGGSSDGVDKMLANLQTSYATTAKALGIAAAATQFSYGGNTGKNGESPNFALGGGAGNIKFYQGETASSDAAISLAASRAVFAALQGSDLPSYLAKVFNGVTADALSQEQITGTLAYAASLKQVRDALLETREPLQILKDNVAQGTAALSTSAETFKTDFVAALDSGITPDKLAQWQGLQGAMEQLAQASGKATEAVKDIGRSIADIASERTRLQDQLDELTMTSAQMLDKQRSAIDDSNKSLFDQVQAQIALKDATTEAADAATKAADAAKAAAETYKQAAADRLSAVTGTASDAYAGLERAVAAQRAQEQAATEAQKAIATEAFTSQNELYQKQIDSTKASLDAVGSSVGKLKSLSSSLKSTMDAMRITGSDAAYRAAAQAQIKAAVATARSGGGLPLDGQLQSALSTVSKPSEDLYATFVDYARDFYSTANDISALTNLTDAQLSADEISQALLKDQVDILEDQKKLLKDGFRDQVSGLDAILANAKQQLDAANGLDTRVLSVADALRELGASIGQLAGTRASQGLVTTPGVAESRATAIKDYITSAMGGGLSGTALANTIASKAKEVGTTEGEIARAIGWDQSKVREFFAGAGIPQFATGTNYVPSNMLAQIHEGEAIIPKAYNPAAGGSGNAELIAEIRALREEVRQLQQSSSTTATATKKTAAMLETATEGGRAMLTEVYA